MKADSLRRPLSACRRRIAPAANSVMGRALLQLGLAISGMGLSPLARADDAAEAPSPAELFSEGQDAFNARRYQRAAELFERADRIRPASQAAYNAAWAWDAAGNSESAANAFVRSLDRGELNADEVREASRRLLELSMALGKLSWTGPSGARIVSSDPPVSVPGTLFVKPGTHRLTCVTSDDTRIDLEVTARAGQALQITCAKPLSTPKGPASGSPAKDPRAEPPRAMPSQSGLNTSQILGVGALGVGAVALGGGIFLNLRGLSANDDFNASGKTDLDARDRAVQLRTLAFVGYGAAAVFGTVGTVLLLGSDSETSGNAQQTPRSARVAPPRVGMQLTPRSVTLRARF